MDKLLKFFIEESIGYKDFRVVSRDIADQVFLLDENEEHFHIEYKDDNIALIYKKVDWLTSLEHYNKSKEQQAIRVARYNEVADKRQLAKNKLLKIMSEKEAEALLYRILNLNELPELRTKLNL